MVNIINEVIRKSEKKYGKRCNKNMSSLYSVINEVKLFGKNNIAILGLCYTMDFTGFRHNISYI